MKKRRQTVIVGKGKIFTEYTECAIVKEIRYEKQCHYKADYLLDKNPV